MANPSTSTWIENNGIVAIEMEHGDLPAGWVVRPNSYTNDTTMVGSMGDGWIEWNGKQLLKTTIEDADANGLIAYKFEIKTPGTYTLNLRSKQYSTVESSDAGNDCFIKFATGTPLEMMSSETNLYTITKLTKVWSQKRDAWYWNTTFELKHHDFVGNPKVEYDAGIHEIWVAGRSKGYALDRFVLFHSSVKSNVARSAPESAIDSGNGILVSVGNDIEIFAPSNSAVLNGSASDDGSIISTTWTQISGPSTATLSGQNTPNLSVSDLVLGTYVFRLTAIDNESNQAFRDVKVVVSEVPESIPLTSIWSEDFNGLSVGSASGDNQTLAGTKIQTAKLLTGKVVAAPTEFTSATGNAFLLSVGASEVSAIRPPNDIDLQQYPIQAGDNYKLSFDLYIPATLGKAVGDIQFRWNGTKVEDSSQAKLSAGVHHIEYFGTFKDGAIPQNCRPFIGFDQNKTTLTDFVYFDNLKMEIWSPETDQKTGFDKFAELHGISADKYADDDNDGLINLFEYALGSHPNDSESKQAKPAIRVIKDENGNVICEYVYNRNADESAVSCRVETIDDLSESTWSDENVKTYSGAEIDGFKSVTNHVSFDGVNKFMRLTIEERAK